MNKLKAKIIVLLHYIWYVIKHPIKYIKYKKLPK